MKATTLTLATLATLLATGTAKAQFYAAFGAGNTMPDSDNGVLAGADADVNDAWAVSGSFGYRFSPSLFVDFSSGLTESSHSVRLTGLGKVASLDQRPMTLSLSYQFLPESKFRPYVSLGYGWNQVSNERTDGVLSGLDINVENGSGFVWGGGADVQLNDNWFLRGDLKKMDFDATVNIETLGNVGKAEVNPLYLQLLVGYQF